MVGSRYKTILVLTLFIFKSADVNVSNFHLLILPEALSLLPALQVLMLKKNTMFKLGNCIKIVK